jgi:hypothetical protein
MNRFLTLLAPAILAAAPVFADEQSDETELVVMRHLAASEAGDASVVPRDYAEDAVVIFGNEATTGVDAIQQVFENLYARTEMRLTFTRTVFEGNVGFVVWTMDDLRGSDTFFVRDGKIVAQTGVVFGPPAQN